MVRLTLADVETLKLAPKLVLLWRIRPNEISIHPGHTYMHVHYA